MFGVAGGRWRIETGCRHQLPDLQANDIRKLFEMFLPYVFIHYFQY